MSEKVIFTHERPPIPTRSHDWRAGFDGREEEGRDGFGETKLAAALDLWDYAETPEEMLAVVLAVLNAQLEATDYNSASPHSICRKIGFQDAIRTVEGIA